MSKMTLQRDRSSDGQKGGRVGAGGGSRYWAPLSKLIFFPGGPIFCHEGSPSPPGHVQTFVSWIFLSTVSQISSDVLWFISVAISGYRTWMRKDLETSTKQNLGGTCSTRRKPASYCLRVKVLPSLKGICRPLSSRDIGAKIQDVNRCEGPVGFFISLKTGYSTFEEELGLNLELY